MKKTLYIFLVFALMIISACARDTQTEAKTNRPGNTKVEIIYLHGSMRCSTCTAVGKYSKELVTELGNKNVVWKEVDLSTPEGERIGDKYEIMGSGLVIAKGSKWEDLTDMSFRYAKSDTPKFKQELKEIIQKYLK